VLPNYYGFADYFGRKIYDILRADIAGFAAMLSRRRPYAFTF